MIIVTMRNPPNTPASVATRERIIENTETLFRKYGWLKTTIADVAKLSGMSPANVYKYFSSKDDLIETIGERKFADLRSEITKIVQSKADYWKKIESMTLQVHRLLRNNLENETNILELILSSRGKGMKFVDNFDRFFVANVMQVLEQGLAAKQLRPLDTMTTAQAITDCLAFGTREIFISEMPAREHEGRLLAQLDLLEHAVKP